VCRGGVCVAAVAAARHGMHACAQRRFATAPAPTRTIAQHARPRSNKGTAGERNGGICLRRAQVVRKQEVAEGRGARNSETAKMDQAGQTAGSRRAAPRSAGITTPAVHAERVVPHAALRYARHARRTAHQRCRPAHRSTPPRCSRYRSCRPATPSNHRSDTAASIGNIHRPGTPVHRCHAPPRFHFHLLHATTLRHRTSPVEITHSELLCQRGAASACSGRPLAW